MEIVITLGRWRVSAAVAGPPFARSTAMRHLLTALPKLALGAAAVVLLVTTLALRQGASAAYDRRDAFAAQVQNGDRTLSVPSVAAEWRQEIAAQRMTAHRDLLLSRLLFGTGLLVVVAFAASFRPSLGERPGPATAISTS
jgi:hypothetical protein